MSNVKAYLEDIVRDGLHDIAEALKGSSPAGDVQASHVIYDNTESGLTSNRVQGAIDELSTKVDTNTSGISDLGDDVSDLTTRVGAAEGDITALDGRLDTAEGDITSLDGRLDTAEGDITSLDGRLDTVKDALDGKAEIGIYTINNQSLNAGLNVIAIPISDITLSDTCISVYTNYAQSDVRLLSWTFVKTSSQWIVCINNSGSTISSVTVVVVYIKHD